VSSHLLDARPFIVSLPHRKLPVNVSVKNTQGVEWTFIQTPFYYKSHQIEEW
jgi:hypothetical protein